MVNMNHAMPTYPTSFPFDPLGSTSNGQHRPRPHMTNSLPLTFKSSPFYRVENPIGNVKICEVMTQHRNTIHWTINMSEYSSLAQCVNNPAYKVLLFCASDVSGVQDVAFPHQSELRINGAEFKANLRGLKNKPGSTRPVDITSAMRLRPNYKNDIDFTYALTNKKFYLLINVCQISTVAELAETVKTRRRIPKESVIAELNKKAQDPDVVATAQVLSLKCPLSYMRLDVPCRGMGCTHIQCFDATSYLQLQEQGPQWLCPICSKSAPFEQLAVDEYVKDILENTPKSLEAVTIEPDGKWVMKAEEDEALPSRPAATNALYGVDDDDDDDFEISEISFIPGRSFDSPRRLASASGTPTSQASRTNGNANNKRPAPVIDLTLSSDDEDEPPRPAKRQNSATSGFTPTAFSFPSPSVHMTLNGPPNGFAS
ncbi:hypothetical protein VHEMI04478 [[Torrubiella] hemipterigena]|nr:hypothetical protein VHEMI04478 [[Torrubiella] hemipterigena]